MSLEEMLLRGELSREPASAGEIRRLIDAAIRRLEDAANTSIHPETRLEQAYHAILNCALAALRVESLRAVNGPGKHRFVLESLADTEGSIHVSEREAEEAVTEASRLLQHLRAWLEARTDAS